MKVMVSKVMSRFLRENVNFCRVSYQEYKYDTYHTCVNFDVWKADVDFILRRGAYKVLRLDYPDECYAMPRYVTTWDLLKVFNRSDKTVAGFLKEFTNEYSI